MHDAIIVGARCAGSPAAMLLARKGYRVLLVDRTTFPSDTISTHLIWPPGIARLRRWGLLDKVTARNCPPIRRVTFDVGEFALAGTPPPADGASESYAPRRTVLDKILVDAAAEAGAELRESFSVQEVVTDGGRVTGIRGRARPSPTVAETARIVIGADGMHSIVARDVQAPEYRTKPPLACWYYTYWSGVPAAGTEYYVRPGRVFACIPTNDGLVCIPTAWTHKEFTQYRANIEGNYLRTLELAPGLADRVRQGKREERFYGRADVPNFFRKPYGPGWALVGDAGYHKDPITAQGSPTPSVMPSYWPRRSMRACPGGGRWRRRWPTTSGDAMMRCCRCTSSPASLPRCSRPRRRCSSFLVPCARIKPRRTASSALLPARCRSRSSSHQGTRDES